MARHRMCSSLFMHKGQDQVNFVEVYKRKNMKLDIAINYVCSWLFFDVSTLKHVLK